MPAVMDALGGGALDHATVYCIEGYLGAARSFRRKWKGTK
jgi:hypothetical protein